jgi:hypothetical protein
MISRVYYLSGEGLRLFHEGGQRFARKEENCNEDLLDFVSRLADNQTDMTRLRRKR